MALLLAYLIGTCIVVGIVAFCVCSDGSKAKKVPREQAAKVENIERKQTELAKEQERLAKEQERQAKELARHEERIAKMEFALDKAEHDIVFLKDRVSFLNGLIEDQQAIRREAEPGSRQEQAAINRIFTLQNQLHTAKIRLGKARFDKERAEEFLSA